MRGFWSTLGEAKGSQIQANDSALNTAFVGVSTKLGTRYLWTLFNDKSPLLCARISSKSFFFIVNLKSNPVFFPRLFLVECLTLCQTQIANYVLILRPKVNLDNEQNEGLYLERWYYMYCRQAYINRNWLFCFVGSTWLWYYFKTSLHDGWR